MSLHQRKTLRGYGGFNHQRSQEDRMNIVRHKSYRRNWLQRFLHKIGIVKAVRPWERKDLPPWQRAMWIQSEPKSLRKVG